MNYKKVMNYYDYILSKVRYKNNIEEKIKKLFDFYGDLELKDVIKKLDNAHSAATDSFYIIHRNMTDINEITKLKEEYINKFVSSSYKGSNRRKVSKKLVGKNKSRGYSGYVDNYYVRSKAEYFYLRYFLKFSKYKIKMEELIFHIDDELSYKPDFILYDNNEIKFIYEVKSGTYDKNKYQKIKDYFNKNNIKFKVLNRSNVIVKKFTLFKDDFEKWKLNCKHDISGSKNPHYGFKHTKKAKKIISEKAKQRAIGNTDIISKISKKAHLENKESYKKGYEKRTKNYYDRLDKKDPFVEYTCITCGKVNKKRTSDIDRITCKDPWCTMRYKESLGWKRREVPEKKNNFKERLIKQSKKVITKNITYSEFMKKIKTYKDDGLIPEKMSFNINVIEKYFGNFENLKRKIYDNKEN